MSLRFMLLRGAAFTAAQLFISSHAYGIDAYGVRGFGSAMPENLFSVAAWTLMRLAYGSAIIMQA